MTRAIRWSVRALLGGLTLSIGVLLLASSARAAWLRPIAEGDTEMTSARALSADGRVAAGDCRDGERDFTCVWSVDGGFEEIVPPVGASDLPLVTALSADGSVAVGATGGLGALEVGIVAFRWTRETGLVELGALGGADWVGSIAQDVSADGATVFGMSVSALGYEVFRWTELEGMQGLGHAGWVMGASDDGDRIVTLALGTPGASCNCWGEIWSMAQGWKQALPPTFFPSGISGNGQVVLGRYGDPAIWSASQGVTLLAPFGVLDWDVNDYPLHAIASGVVVGGSAQHGGAFLWNPIRGTRGLADVSLEQGLDLSDCSLHEMNGLSADGLRMVTIGPCARFGDTSHVMLVDIAPACMDGVDGDGDGNADFPTDDGCVNGFDEDERPDVGCGLGPELAIALPLLLALRNRRRSARG